jgi:hypothetical protein
LVVQNLITSRNTTPAAPLDHPQTTYPQPNPQQLWGSHYSPVQKLLENRDLLENQFSIVD